MHLPVIVENQLARLDTEPFPVVKAPLRAGRQDQVNLLRCVMMAGVGDSGAEQQQAAARYRTQQRSIGPGKAGIGVAVEERTLAVGLGVPRVLRPAQTVQERGEALADVCQWPLCGQCSCAVEMIEHRKVVGET